MEIELIEKFLNGSAELTSKIIHFEGYDYACNNFVMTRVKSKTKKENHPKGQNLLKLMAPKEGKKISIKIPFIADIDYEPLDLSEYVFADVNVGVFEDGMMSLWCTLNEDKREKTLSRINLGNLIHLTRMHVDFYFRGKLDSIYFEADFLEGTLMPCRQDVEDRR